MSKLLKMIYWFNFLIKIIAFYSVYCSPQLLGSLLWRHLLLCQDKNHTYAMWSIQQLSVIHTRSNGLGLTHCWVEILCSLSLVFSHNESVLAKQLPVRHGRWKIHGILGGNNPQFCWAAISSSVLFLSDSLFCHTTAFFWIFNLVSCLKTVSTVSACSFYFCVLSLLIRSLPCLGSLQSLLPSD